jgi:6-phosphogluconolactonase
MRYLAIDYGQKRTGLAVSDAGESMAFPHSVLEANADMVAQIVRIIRQERIDVIVVGLPLNMDGTEGPQAKAVRLFGQKLSAKVSMEITYFDERLSSSDADWKLSGLELTRGKKKKLQDAIAAAVFLQAFLDERKKANSTPEIIRLQTSRQVAQKALEIFSLCACNAIERKGIFTCAISGGDSPKEFFELLPTVQSLDWKHIHIFWADERGVGPQHPDSNFNLANTAFLSKVPIPQDNIHRVQTELSDIHQAAKLYEQTLQDRLGSVPEFDLILLGLGTDGHTASLLPVSQVIDIKDRLTAVVDRPSHPHSRVTLTVPVLLSAHKLLFLICGPQKAQIVHDVLSESSVPQHWPVHALWPARQKMTWLLDFDAASLLH